MVGMGVADHRQFRFAGWVDREMIAEANAVFKSHLPLVSDIAQEMRRFLPAKAFDVFYKSQIGKIVKIFGFALKDRISNVVKMIKFLISVKSPYEVLEEGSKNHEMHIRFKQIYKKYQKLIEKAKTFAGENKVLFFQYAGDLSISADLSNELIYTFPEKLIVVVYVTGIKANISVRGKNARTIILKVIKDIEGATGGGHESAVGCQMKVEYLKNFKENIEREIN